MTIDRHLCRTAKAVWTAAMLIAAFSLSLAASAQTLPVTYKNSVYTLTYDAETKRLTCASDNTDCVWRVEVSQRVDDFRSFAAVATAAGPVIVYSEGNQTFFALLHFRSGSTTVEGGGESLRGSIGAGWMLNCVMQAEQYGAKVVCQTVQGTTIREYKWDINMGGQHKLIEESEAGAYTAGSAPKSQKLSIGNLKVSLDLPRGFRSTPHNENAVALYGPTDSVFMTVFSDAGALPLAEFGEAYMNELEVTVTQRSDEHLDDGTPALLLMGTGKIDEVDSLHVVVFFNSATRTYAISLSARADVGTGYVPAFQEVMQSLKTTE